MCRRIFDELQWDARAVGLLQRIEQAGPIFEILIGDFELAFELDPLVRPNLRLSCSCESFLTLRISLPESGCTAEQHQNGHQECGAVQRAERDPWGTDLFVHGGTFL